MKTEEKIPKILHYVWLGRGKKSKLTLDCIETWKKHCPDYEIIEWNEDNFDVNSHPFLKEAYDNKKWAFASDYIRLSVLEKYGGIYLDCDVELMKNFDELLQKSAFFGFENGAFVETATIGCVKHHPIIQDFLKMYENRHFIKKNGSFDMTTNTVLLTTLLKNRYNLLVNNTTQNLSDNAIVFSNDYFCPKSYATGKIYANENTFCIHHFDGSWLKTNKCGGGILCFFVNLIGVKNSDRITRMYFSGKIKKIWKDFKRQQNNVD